MSIIIYHSIIHTSVVNGNLIIKTSYEQQQQKGYNNIIRNKNLNYWCQSGACATTLNLIPRGGDGITDNDVLDNLVDKLIEGVSLSDDEESDKEDNEEDEEILPPHLARIALAKKKVETERKAKLKADENSSSCHHHYNQHDGCV